jgi:hypothetical protein
LANKTENKSLEQLINKFTEASTQTKELDKVISNFSKITDEFRETLEIVDSQIKATEMSQLSKEAVDRLKEIKSFNDMQILDNFDSVAKKHFADYFKKIYKLMNDNTQDSMAKIEKQLEKLVSTYSEVLTDDKAKEEREKEQEEKDRKQNELLTLLKRIDNQTRSFGHYAAPQNSEEIIQLRRLVSNLGRKLKRIEEDYENRISELENEIEVLKSNPDNKSNPYENSQFVDISDEDLPF